MNQNKVRVRFAPSPTVSQDWLSVLILLVFILKTKII